MDLSLLAERAARDPQAFENLYRALYTHTYNYVRYRVNSRQLAEDLTSQVFTRLLEKLDSYSADKGPFKPWFYALSRNVIAGHFRRRVLLLETLTDKISNILSGSPGPEEFFIQEEMQQSLLKALKHLNQRDRDLLGLKFALGLSHREMAELTGLSESNVGVIVFRSLRRLRQIMNQQDERTEENPPEVEEVVDHG
ncbi:MAG: sigma-70 family RNA polymerase sigma factor [Anaerolineales bacterium]|jgi:RNA polymerase sigma-70 factor (ECF subfamily)